MGSRGVANMVINLVLYRSSQVRTFCFQQANAKVVTKVVKKKSL